MKKVISLLVVIVLSTVALTACSKERTKTYEGDVNGKNVITSLTYKDDEVLKQSTIGTLKYDDLGIDKSQAKEIFKKDEKTFKGLKGVTYKVDYKDQKAVEHIEIDYKDVDVDKLKKNLGFESAKAVKDDYVSMHKIVKQLKRNGLKEKSKMNDEE
ncbi:YehR family lipoprotein [Staphylococcus caprae]|uniref:YehR family lipoprotein n=1 Tax=Staphylococcus caprae TaxID=29380 RepID=UPI003B21C0B3